jgi:hypothetical protein
MKMRLQCWTWIRIEELEAAICCYLLLSIKTTIMFASFELCF